MSIALPKITLVINTISTPLGFALYKDNTLFKEWMLEGYISDKLILEIDRLLNTKDAPTEILYINGPGSQMGIKLSYIALKTLYILKGIPFFGISAFSLNGGRPIKAMGKLYFVKVKDTIITQPLKENILQEFSFPLSLDSLIRESDNRPDYRLPAV